MEIEKSDVLSLPVRLVPWAGLALLVLAVVVVLTGGPPATIGILMYVAATMLGVRVEPPTPS